MGPEQCGNPRQKISGTFQMGFTTETRSPEAGEREDRPKSPGTRITIPATPFGLKQGQSLELVSLSLSVPICGSRLMPCTI
jgi:hypothetical protein